MSEKRRRSRLVRPAGILLGLLVALGLAEVAVRLFVPVRNVGPMFSVYDPEYGKRLKPSFSAVRTSPEFRMEFTTNSGGYRGPEVYDDDRGLVLCLGDSFTMGYGVSDGEEFPRLLAQPTNPLRPPRVQVLNAGIGNGGNGRWIKLLRDQGEALDPALVVLQVAGNDPADNAVEGLFSQDADGSLRELEGPAPRHVLRAVQGAVEAIPLLSSSHLFCLIRDGSLRGTPRTPTSDAVAVEQGALDLTLAILTEVLDLCDAGGWPVLALSVSASTELEAALTELFESRDVSLIRIPSKAERPDLYFGVDAHWNAAGHLAVAREIHAHPLFEETAYGEPAGLKVPEASPLWEYARKNR